MWQDVIKTTDDHRYHSNRCEDHSDDEGSGSPVLLLHGFPSTRHLWSRVAPVLAQAGFRVVDPRQTEHIGEALRTSGVPALVLWGTQAPRRSLHAAGLSG